MYQHAHLPSAEGFLPPQIVGTFYMQGYKVEEKTAIVPHCTPSFKTQWAPCVYKIVETRQILGQCGNDF
jgi:hypothetical protein